MTCNGFGLNIRDASESSVIVQQTRGQEGIGSITAGWFEGDTLTSEGSGEISSSRGAVEIENTEGAAADYVEVSSEQCPSVSDTMQIQ